MTVKTEHERRVIPADLTVTRWERRDGDGDGDEAPAAPVLRVAGYAARTGVWSEDLGGFREMLEPGAFGDALGVSDVRYLVNHDGIPLARSTNGTLRLSETPEGLWVEADWPDTQYARDLWVSLERGDVNQMSFAFTVGTETWSEDWAERRINKVRELFDVALVTYPAYPQTTAAVRALVAGRQTEAAGGLTPDRRRLLDARQRWMNRITGGVR